MQVFGHDLPCRKSPYHLSLTVNHHGPDQLLHPIEWVGNNEAMLHLRTALLWHLFVSQGWDIIGDPPHLLCWLPAGCRDPNTEDHRWVGIETDLVRVHPEYPDDQRHQRRHTVCIQHGPWGETGLRRELPFGTSVLDARLWAIRQLTRIEDFAYIFAPHRAIPVFRTLLDWDDPVN